MSRLGLNIGPLVWMPGDVPKKTSTAEDPAAHPWKVILAIGIVVLAIAAFISQILYAIGVALLALFLFNVAAGFFGGLAVLLRASRPDTFDSPRPQEDED